MKQTFSDETRAALDSMLNNVKQDKEEANKVKKGPVRTVESDDHLNFTQLLSKNQEMSEKSVRAQLVASYRRKYWTHCYEYHIWKSVNHQRSSFVVQIVQSHSTDRLL
jgi:hypothetical protein